MQQVVGPLESVLPILRQVQRQDRLVDLHPFHTLRGQTLKDFAVNRQQALQQVEAIELAALGLAQPQVSQRPDQHRLDGVAQHVRFLDFIKQLRPAQLELLIGRELRDQVVVVGIKPLGHLLGMGPSAAAVAALVGNGTPRHSKQGLQGRLAVCRAKALGDHAEGQRVAQYVVVPGKVADRQQVEASSLLHLPMGGA